MLHHNRHNLTKEQLEDLKVGDKFTFETRRGIRGWHEFEFPMNFSEVSKVKRISPKRTRVVLENGCTLSIGACFREEDGYHVKVHEFTGNHQMMNPRLYQEGDVDQSEEAEAYSKRCQAVFDAPQSEDFLYPKKAPTLEAAEKVSEHLRAIEKLMNGDSDD